MHRLQGLMLFANAKGWVVSQTIAEIGSGLNGHRPNLKKIIDKPEY